VQGRKVREQSVKRRRGTFHPTIIRKSQLGDKDFADIVLIFLTILCANEFTLSAARIKAKAFEKWRFFVVLGFFLTISGA